MVVGRHHGRDEEHQAQVAEGVGDEQRDQRVVEGEPGQAWRDVPLRQEPVGNQAQQELETEDLKAVHGPTIMEAGPKRHGQELNRLSGGEP